MGGTIKLFKLFGVPVRMHWTFLFLFFFFASQLGIGLTIVTVLSVLAHEFGHVLAARRYGYSTQSVVMWALGMAALIRTDFSRGELAISLAGPIVNFVIAGLSLTVSTLVEPTTPFLTALDSGSFMLFVINMVLGTFNLLPMYPLDGGRVLRSVISRWTTKIKATRIATIIGSTLAVAFGAWTISNGNYFDALIPAFIIMYSWREVAMMERQGERPGML